MDNYMAKLDNLAGESRQAIITSLHLRPQMRNVITWLACTL